MHVLLRDRFDTDDLVLRLAMLTAMLAVAWLAAEIPRAFASPGGGAGVAVRTDVVDVRVSR